MIADATAATEADSTLDADAVVVAIEIISPSTRLTDPCSNPPCTPQLASRTTAPRTRPHLCLGHLERRTYTDRLIQAGKTTALTDPFPLDLDPATLRR
nr:hypothetical protein [Streptomyces sp. TLI_235]